MPGVGGIAVDDRSRLLLARRSDTGGWAVLAGMVEPGEQPGDTVVREVREAVSSAGATPAAGSAGSRPAGPSLAGR
ncbi:NUDIX domain-containing protein [Dactylosporangium sp. NPDC000521]|uniref:NUDIX domain-containing protein n=1 Tax=Dactylosporangium sp. NPDC000521 TaxID=3363975 RepID=UPI0036B75FF5